jgi:hypothetical protein
MRAELRRLDGLLPVRCAQENLADANWPLAGGFRGFNRQAIRATSEPIALERLDSQGIP